MSVAKVTEITSTSKKSFDDAIQQGIKRANKTLKNVTGAWIKSTKVAITKWQNHGLPGQYEIDFYSERLIHKTAYCGCD